MRRGRYLWRRRFRRLSVALAVLGWLAGCQHRVIVEQGSSPSALIGQIWDVQGGRIISRDSLLERAAAARFILIGEIHDNPDHHRIQAEVLRTLSARSRLGLAMEQFDSDRQAAIDAARREPGVSSETLADAGSFDRKAWGWQLYEPLVTIALDAGLPIVAINLSRAEARRVGAEGFAALGSARVARLALDENWNAEREEVLTNEISAGHCGQLPVHVLGRFVAAQRARDASMADALLSVPTGRALATIGQGHARKDIGVPVYLAHRAPKAGVISIGLIEVQPGREQVADYLSSQSTKAAFDYLWFTPPAKADDPCADFKLPAPR